MAASGNGTVGSTQPKVSVRGLWKIFGDSVPPELTDEIQEKSKAELREQDGLVIGLRDVNFDVQQGETFVVMGLSGSGKSTLVRTLLRLIEPTFGSIEVDGEDILQYDEAQLIEYRRSKTAMVFQHFGLLPHRTVEENAAWGLEVNGVPRDERMARAHEALETVGLNGWEHYRPNALSGGMQQRVGLARAMAIDPDVLLMDEPFSGLDPLIRRDMQNELLRLQEEWHRTIILITHDMNEALKLGDHILIMRDGGVVQNGTREEILGQPADGYVAEFVRDVRKSSVITLRSLMQRPAVRLRSDMSPRQGMEALGSVGEVAGFVTDRQQVYVGAVSFNSLAEANQRGGRRHHEGAAGRRARAVGRYVHIGRPAHRAPLRRRSALAGPRGRSRRPGHAGRDHPHDGRRERSRGRAAREHGGHRRGRVSGRGTWR